MSAAKAKKSKPTRANAKAVKAKAVKAKSRKAKPAKSRPMKTKAATKRAKPAPSAPQPSRPFRFTAAQTVLIRFPRDKKPENFRIDDMVEVTMSALDGRTRVYYQYRLVSNDKVAADGSERHFWFLDPKPVGLPDPVGPSLWRRTTAETMDGHDVVDVCSGNFSTRSVTSYDGSGYLEMVMLSDKFGHRMRLDLNGKREFCDSVMFVMGKDDVLSIIG